MIQHKLKRVAFAIASSSRPLLLILLTSVAGPSRAESPKIYIFDVLHRDAYRAAYEHMLSGRTGLQPWMATAEAAMTSTAEPGVVIENREIFAFCEPHNCGGHTFVVGFKEFEGEAIGLLSIDGRAKVFGHPTAAERRALLSQMAP